MRNISNSYLQGIAATLQAYGFNKQAVANPIETIKILEKSAQFNFSNGDGGGIKLKDILIPAAVATGTGYVAYNAAKHGDPNKTAYENIKNYIAGLVKSIRKKPGPLGLFNPAKYN